MKRGKVLVFAAAAVAAVALAQGPGGFTAPPPAKPGPYAKLKDGKPNFNGYWETRVFYTAFDVEERKEAAFEIPAGPGVIVDPADKKIPYKPEMLAKRNDIFANHLADDPQAHCFLSGVPRQMYTPFGFQIVQAPNAVLLMYEAFHAFRTIHMSGKHPDQAIKLFEGDSRGRWEGDTLVVDTANLNGRTWFDMAGNFHSDKMTVVERFSPINKDTILYRATITDPETFTRPWTMQFELGRNMEPNYEILEYACVEGEQDLQHYTESVGGGAKDAK